MKKISIFVPVYNCEEYLEECLKSIENQTFNKDEIEVIIINDGSSDNSLNIINIFSKKNSNWIIRNRENKGVAVTRNEGLDLVTGEYLMFLDSDDYLEKDAVANIYKELTENNFDIGIFKTNYFDKKNNYGEKNSMFFNNGKIITNLNEKPELVRFIRNAAIIYKKEIIKQIRFIPNVVHEDNYFCVKAYSLANKIYISDTHIYNIRKREGESLSIMQQLNFKTYQDFLINVIKEDKEIKKSAIIKIHINQLIGYIRKNIPIENIKEAVYLLFKYLRDLEKENIISKLTYCKFFVYARLKCLLHLQKKILKQNSNKKIKNAYKNSSEKDSNLDKSKSFDDNYLVSIIIPTFKRPGMLSRAIDSCLKQTYKNIEILVVDDNNPDTDGRIETEKFMQQYCDIKQVRYIKSKKNGGGAVARNVGIKNAKGEYIAFLDDDDYFFEDKIKKQLDFMIKNGYDASFTGVETYDETKNKLIKVKRHENFEEFDNIFVYHLVEMIVSPQTFMYKKDVLDDIGGFDDVKAGQEYHLMYKTIKKEYKVGCLHDVLTRICVHSGERITTGKNKLKAEKDLYLLKKKHFDMLTFRQKQQVKYIYKYNIWNKYKDSNDLKQYWWLAKIIICHPLILFERKVLS